MSYQPVKIYLTTFCPFCLLATRFFKKRKIPFERIHVDNYPGGFEALKQATGYRMVPQIFIGDKMVGGYDDVVRLEKSGKLEELLKA